MYDIKLEEFLNLFSMVLTSIEVNQLFILYSNVINKCN